MNGDVKTKIIKRNGEEVTFDLDKIINAITKANKGKKIVFKILIKGIVRVH